MQWDKLSARASEILDKALEKNKKIATAESCTGGLLGALFTEIAGSSSVYERGFITYSNEAKMEIIDVPTDTLEQFGAVSAETARAMALGTLKHSHADIAVSVTGVAGPGGGTKEKPVGLVYTALAERGNEDNIIVVENLFDGHRTDIREHTVNKIFDMIIERLT